MRRSNSERLGRLPRLCKGGTEIDVLVNQENEGLYIPKLISNDSMYRQKKRV